MTEEEQRSEKRKATNAILWIVAALVATYAALALPLPYKVIAPVFALAALVLSIRVFRLASKVRNTVLVWLAGTAGLIGALFYGSVAISQIIMWQPTQDYEQCMAEALTETAVEDCETQYSENLWL